LEDAVRLKHLATTSFAVLVIIGLTLAADSFAGDTIRIGFVADVTGIGEVWYKSQKAGMDLFIEEVNAAGGVLGKKLELVVRDSKLKPDLGERAARELIVDEKCDFLMGPTSSSVAVSVSKVAHELKKVVCFHASNSEGLTTTYFHPYLFQVAPNSGIESRGVAMFLAFRGFKRYSYLGPDYEFARNYWANFKTELTRRKPEAEILDEVWVPLGKTEFSEYIPGLVARNPDIVITNLWGPALVSFVKQVKTTELLRKASIICLFDLDTLRSIGLEMPEGLMGNARAPFYGIRDRRMKDFVRKFYDKYQQWPSDWAIQSYDGLVALTEAIKKANSIDTDKVAKALEGLHFRSLRGWQHIRPEDHMADVGIYVGWTTKDPRFPDFLIMRDVTKVPADTVWMPVDEVKKLQPKTK